MENEVLNYIGLNIENEDIPEKLKCSKPSYETGKSIDNTTTYKIYKKNKSKRSFYPNRENDRTTNIKERYNSSVTLEEYIKNNKEDFVKLAERTSVEKVQELENLQKSFQDKIPFFVKYDKNYLWQIYYSKSDDKLFMLFPAKEGETEVLFYMIKEILSNEESLIYVPICQEDYDENVFTNTKQIDDLENYIWTFTKQWPKTYEVKEKNETKLYIIGKTNLINNLETKYRIIIDSQEALENEYTLFKALFILSTETSHLYKFETQIDKKGKLALFYKKKNIYNWKFT